MSRNREKKAIGLVACPECGAALGQLCRRPDAKGGYSPKTQHGRPMICAGRRTAWQMVKNGEV